MAKKKSTFKKSPNSLSVAAKDRVQKKLKQIDDKEEEIPSDVESQMQSVLSTFKLKK